MGFKPTKESLVESEDWLWFEDLLNKMFEPENCIQDALHISISAPPPKTPLLKSEKTKHMARTQRWTEDFKRGGDK